MGLFAGIARVAAPLAARPAPSQVLPELPQLLLQPSHPLPSPSLPSSLPPNVFSPWILHVLNS